MFPAVNSSNPIAGVSPAQVPNITQKTQETSSQHFTPGSFSTDFHYDQAVYQLQQHHYTDANGVGSEDWLKGWSVTPELGKEGVRAIKSFLDQAVPYFLFFDAQAVNDAKARFKHLTGFLQTPLMTKKEMDLPFSLCPGEFYRKLLDYIQIQYKGPILIESMGGHARQFLYSGSGTSWGEGYFQSIAPALNLPLSKLLERFKKNPPDSDCRILLPAASLAQLNQYRRFVMTLIVELIQKNETYANPQFTEPLLWLVENYGLEKFWCSPSDDLNSKNVYSVVSFSRKTKSLEILFVKKMERNCMFHLDGFKIPIQQLIANPESSVQYILPYSSNSKQTVADAVTYLLNCPNPATADETVFFAGLLHQIKGGRYYLPGLEHTLLSKVLEKCLSTNPKAKKKYDAKLVVAKLSRVFIKFLKNHGGDDALVFTAFFLRLVGIMKKYEQEIPANVPSELHKELLPHLKLVTRSDSFARSPLLKNLLEQLSSHSIEIEALIPALKLFTFINLGLPTSDNQTNKIRTYITRDGDKPAFLVENGYILSSDAEVNSLWPEFLKRLSPQAVAPLQHLFNFFRPEQALDFEHSTHLKNHLKSLEIDFVLLEKNAFEFLNHDLPFVRHLGYHLLLLCYDLHKTEAISPLLHALPEVLASEHDPAQYEILLASLENMINHAKGALVKASLFPATRELANDKKLTPQALAIRLIDDLLNIPIISLQNISWGLFLKYFQRLSFAEQKSEGLKFMDKFKAKGVFVLKVFEHLRDKKLLAGDELFKQFEALCLSLKDKKEVQLKLYEEALGIVTGRPKPDKKSKTLLPASASIPHLVASLMRSGYKSEAHHLLTQASERNFVTPSPLSEECWLNLALYNLDTKNYEEALKCWEKAKGNTNTYSHQQIDVLLQIVNNMLECEDKHVIALADRYIPILFSAGAKEGIQKRILERLQNLAASSNWDQMIHEMDKRYDKLDVNEKLQLKFKALTYKLEREQPLNYAKCIALAMELLDAEYEPDELVRKCELLVVKLTDPTHADLDDRLSLAYNWMTQRLSKKMPAGWHELYSDFIQLYIRGSLHAENKHLYNSCNFFLDRIETNMQPNTLKTGQELLLKALASKSGYANYLPAKIVAKYDALIAKFNELKLSREILDITSALISSRVNLEYKPERAHILIESADTYFDDPDCDPLFLDSIFSALKWFLVKDAPAAQLAFYKKLMSKLLSTNNDACAVSWFRRMANHENFDDTSSAFDWIKTLISKNQLKSAHEFFDSFKNRNCSDLTLMSSMVWDTIRLFHQKQYPDLINLFLQNSALLNRLKTADTDKEIILHPIRELMALPCNEENTRKVFKLCSDYQMGSKEMLTDFLKKIETAHNLEILQLVKNHHIFLSGIMGESPLNAFWEKIVDGELKPIEEHVELFFEVTELCGGKFSEVFLRKIIEKHQDLDPKFDPKWNKLLTQTLFNIWPKRIVELLLLSNKRALMKPHWKKFVEIAWTSDELYKLLPVVLSFCKDYNDQIIIEILQKVVFLFTKESFNEEKFYPIHKILFQTELYLLISHLLPIYFENFLKSPELITQTLDKITSQKYFSEIIFILNMPNIKEIVGEKVLTQFSKRVVKNLNANNCAHPPSLRDRILSLELSLKKAGSNDLKTVEILTKAKEKDPHTFMNYFLKNLFHIGNAHITCYYFYRLLEKHFHADLRNCLPASLFESKKRLMEHESGNGSSSVGNMWKELLDNRFCFNDLLAFENDGNELPTLKLFPTGAIHAVNEAIGFDIHLFYSYHIQVLNCIMNYREDNTQNVKALLGIAYSIIVQIMSRKKIPQNYSLPLRELFQQFIFWENIKEVHTFKLHFQMTRRLIQFIKEQNYRLNYMSLDHQILLHLNLLDIVRQNDAKEAFHLLTIINERESEPWTIHAIDLFEKTFAAKIYDRVQRPLACKVITSQTLRHPFVILDESSQPQESLAFSMVNSETMPVQNQRYSFEKMQAIFVQHCFDLEDNKAFEPEEYHVILKTWIYTLGIIFDKYHDCFGPTFSVDGLPIPDCRPYRIARALLEMLKIVGKCNYIDENQKWNYYKLILAYVYQLTQKIDFLYNLSLDFSFDMVGLLTTLDLDLFKDLFADRGIEGQEKRRNVIFKWIKLLVDLRERVVNHIIADNTEEKLNLPKQKRLFSPNILLKGTIYQLINNALILVKVDPTLTEPLINDIKTKEWDPKAEIVLAKTALG